ncbi:hypothetical protein [Shewanella baltica]|uniref:hypothetical protein n=1 Tax=Shewanella baltica TaxID=62322 RepID=UPI00217CF824|nr:hypothetical protein [Shewanella baltica]MCS6096198.1 hypothetical protein [Shewanella baltica]MCS6227306.1 hypothetical protein [Shewanella baltica]
MQNPTKSFTSLVEMLNLERKRELAIHCKNLVIYQQDLTALIIGAQHGVFAPYKYANHFEKKIPDSLVPNEAEHKAFTENWSGAFRTKLTQKFPRKIFQLVKQQRCRSAHLLYTPNQRYWHLFYFDNHDTLKSKNHWKCGSHIHYVSYLWPELTLQNVWAQVQTGELKFSQKLHIKYQAQQPRTKNQEPSIYSEPLDVNH